MGKISLFLIVSILLAGAVTASSYTIEISQISGKSLVKHIITLDSEKTLYIPLPSDASALSSNQNYSLGASSLEIKGKEIELSYLTSSNLEQSDEGYFFVDAIKLPFPVDKAEIKLILQEGNYFEEGKMFPVASIGSDGQQIIASWVLNDVNAGSDIPIFASIKTPTSSLSTIFWVIIAFALAVIFYLIYLNLRKLKATPAKKRKSKKKTAIKEKQSEERQEYEKYLMESEKAVIDALKEAENHELWQKQIQLKTNFSKAKLSRVIRNLESRNLIEKVPLGNTNKIKLK